MAPPKGPPVGGDGPAKLSSSLLNLPFMQRGKQPSGGAGATSESAASNATPGSAPGGAAAPRRGETAQLSDRLQGMKFMQRGAAQKRKADDAFGDDEEEAAKKKAEQEVSVRGRGRVGTGAWA